MSLIDENEHVGETYFHIHALMKSDKDSFWHRGKGKPANGPCHRQLQDSLHFLPIRRIADNLVSITSRYSRKQWTRASLSKLHLIPRKEQRALDEYPVVILSSSWEVNCARENPMRLFLGALQIGWEKTSRALNWLFQNFNLFTYQFMQRCSPLTHTKLTWSKRGKSNSAGVVTFWLVERKAVF